MGNSQVKNLDQLESKIDLLFIDLVNDMTQIHADPYAIVNYTYSSKNIENCRVLIYETHNMFKSKRTLENVITINIPLIITHLNTISSNDLHYKQSCINILKNLTELINKYISLKSRETERLQTLETENQELKIRNRELNEHIISSSMQLPPQHLSEVPMPIPSAPKLIDQTTNNCPFVIEL